MTPFNTFGMKVSAAKMVDYYSPEELHQIYDMEDLPKPFLHIGGGSNILFTNDYSGTILHSRIRFINADGEDEVSVRVGAGVPWDEFCDWCARRALWGPENLSGIPGEVGAAAVQNIGAYGREVCEIISTVECYDSQTRKMVAFKPSECGYGYRTSIFKGKEKGRYVVTAVSFALTTQYDPKLDYGNVKEAVVAACGHYAVYEKALTPSKVRKVILSIRDKKLPSPKEYGSAGSFYRNPFVTKEKYEKIAAEYPDVPHFEMPDGKVKIPAAWMIDQCGWKNYREGNVGVWSQPLVIINATGKATPLEIMDLEDKITASVQKKFGVTLEPEVEHIYNQSENLFETGLLG